MTEKPPVILDIKNLTKRFGGLIAINDFSANVYRGEILGLIGPNGAGKSTILNMIGGSLLPTRGNCVFEGENITGLPPHKISKKGIARVFQGNVLFRNLSVKTNVLCALHTRNIKGFFSSFLGATYSRKVEKTMDEKIGSILELVGLTKNANELALNLSHGNQRLLCLAVALAGDPKLLLLDEPVTGMNAMEVTDMVALIKMLKEKRGITSIVVEHNMKAVMSLCERIVCISYGTKISEGCPSEVCSDQNVIEAYLGVEQDAIGN
jgi:branched-chain amino acid transport system ATP-binding protein